jgi:hypothetical protein
MTSKPRKPRRRFLAVEAMALATYKLFEAIKMLIWHRRRNLEAPAA